MQNNQVNQPVDNDIAWDAWPDNIQHIPALNLNVMHEDPPVLDLNALPDMQEIIIDPVINQQQQELIVELNDLLNQVNEEEEDEAGLQEAPEPLVNNPDQGLINPPEVELNLLVINQPGENFLHLEI